MKLDVRACRLTDLTDILQDNNRRFDVRIKENRGPGYYVMYEVTIYKPKVISNSKD